MEAIEQRIVIFKREDGQQPFRTWLNGIRDQRTVRKIEARVARIRLGNFGDSKPVGEGVIEYRIDYGPGYRAYFGRDGETIVVLLCGGDKSTQNKDIALAKQYWNEYKEKKDEKSK